MSMSRKDYQAVAAVVRNRIDSIMRDPRTDVGPGDVRVKAVAATARDLADAFKSANPNFRYDTFFEACGLDEWGAINRWFAANDTQR